VLACSLPGGGFAGGAAGGGEAGKKKKKKKKDAGDSDLGSDAEDLRREWEERGRPERFEGEEDDMEDDGHFRRGKTLLGRAQDNIVSSSDEESNKKRPNIISACGLTKQQFKITFDENNCTTEHYLPIDISLLESVCLSECCI
jgi:hypothetical protein